LAATDAVVPAEAGARVERQHAMPADDVVDGLLASRETLPVARLQPERVSGQAQALKALLARRGQTRDPALEDVVGRELPGA
jgi:hypothetical protein